MQRTQTFFSNGFKRGAVFRAAAAALSCSISQDSQLSRKRKMMIEEARATLPVGKSLGMNCDGKEVEVIQKIVQLEIQDEDRFVKGKGGGLVKPT